MKKILIIITTAFVPWGGLTTVVMNYYRAMDKAGLRIDFASDNAADPLLLEELGRNGSTYIRLPDRQKHILQYMSALYRKLKKGGYDVVHIHGNSATMAFDLFPAWLVKVKKRIVHVHNVRNAHRILHGILKCPMNRWANCRLAVSEEAGRYLYGGREFMILNNAIDVEHYRFDPEDRSKCREEWKVPQSALLVGTVGKMNGQKNQKFLVEVFSRVRARIPDARLLIVGDGQLRGEIEKQVSLLGMTDSCILTGMQDDSARFLSAMDVFVFPSLYEGLSLALLEAQVSGLKCCYTATLSKRGIVTADCMGLRLDDMDGWVRAVAGAGRYDREEASKEGIAKATAQGFNIRYEAEQLRRIYGQFPRRYEGGVNQERKN